MRRAIYLLLLLAGCSSKPDVHPVGNGRYTVIASTSTQASNGMGVARALAMKKATAFCDQKSMSMNTETFDDETEARSRSSSLVFSCR
jgi:hypothetical protein